MGHEVGLSERAQYARGQESGSDVCGRFLHVRPENIHDSEEEKDEYKSL